jgi:hypothetical protein
VTAKVFELGKVAIYTNVDTAPLFVSPQNHTGIAPPLLPNGCYQ